MEFDEKRDYMKYVIKIAVMKYQKRKNYMNYLKKN